MRQIFLSFVVVLATISGACHKSTMAPTPTEPELDPTKPLDVVLLSGPDHPNSPKPENNGTIHLGQEWQLDYIASCTKEGWFWGFYYVRDDGATRFGDEVVACNGRRNSTILGVQSREYILYQFGRGHRITIKVAMAPDIRSVDSNTNVIVLDKDIVTWFIAD